MAIDSPWPQWPQADTGKADPAVRQDRDVFRLAPGLDDTVLETIAARLEFRGTDEGYIQLSQAHFSRLPLGEARRILALGCGTGIEVRALRRLTGSGTAIVGVDHSLPLLEVARRLTEAEGLLDNVTYRAGDAHGLPFADGEFDIAVLHTMISHADDALQTLREVRRVVRPGGTIAIFDGDYASMTFAYPDHALAKSIEEALRQVMVANPRIMRDLPRLLRQVGLDLAEADSVVYADIGTSNFWLSTAESYGALLARAGLLPPAVIDDWRAFHVKAAEDSTFFGASNYYTYLIRRPG